jgi:hypothetical protein
MDDYELKEIEKIEFQLSEEDEKMLAEVEELSKSIPQDKDLLSDLIDASIKGSMNYVDSFIDITEIGDYQKNSQSIRDNDKQEIQYAATSSNPEENSNRHYRTLEEARYTPYAKDATRDNSNMSEIGKKRLEQYEKEYRNRIKTVDRHPKDYKTNEKSNFESLSGLESYRLGPSIPAYSPEEYKRMYEAAGSPDNMAKWMRDTNFSHFNNEMYKEFGFNNKTEFDKWRRENKLTIHEGPDGMYLVPSDVHRLEQHSGQVSKIHAYLKGEITKEEYEEWEKKAKRERQIQELKVRGTRAAIGAVKGDAIAIGKQLIVILAQEIKEEFIHRKELVCSFIDHIKNVFQNWCKRLKEEWKNIAKNFGSNVAGSIAMEGLNAIVDFLLHSFKNFAKMIRLMLNSIIRALKIIFDGNRPWEERLFEALKILAAGMTALIGLGLNEVITDFITTSIPVLASVAPFIADAFSGFISCVASSVVLCLFDRFKANLQITSQKLRIDLLNTKMIYTSSSLALVSSIKTGYNVRQTLDFEGRSIVEMGGKSKRIKQNLKDGENVIHEAKKRAEKVTGRISTLLEEDDDNE